MYTNSTRTILNREDYRTIILGLKLVVDHRIKGEYKAAERLIARFEIERRPLEKAKQPNWVPIKSNWPSGQAKQERKGHWSYKRPAKASTKKPKKQLTADEILASIWLSSSGRGQTVRPPS